MPSTEKPQEEESPQSYLLVRICGGYALQKYMQTGGKRLRENERLDTQRKECLP